MDIGDIVFEVRTQAALLRVESDESDYLSVHEFLGELDSW